MVADLKEYLSGNKLYGDDFDATAIEEWYRDEEEAYYELAHDISEYEYHAFNAHYAFNKLKSQHFDTCLAFGCADGEDVAPLASRVDRFIAVEPAEKWWRDTIGNKPATYIKPAMDGTIPLPPGSVDMAVCLGVIHHIPNVSHVVAEMHRVLKSGGILILREPIFSMGDWRKKRPGLTSRERGIPPKLLTKMIESLGFNIEFAKPCMVPLTPRIAKLFGITFAYNSPVMVRLDEALSKVTAWNMRYHRESLPQKMAPTSLYIMASKS